MTLHDEIQYRVSILLDTRKNDVSVFLFLCGLLLSMGFAFGIGNNANYQLIYSFGGQWFWTSLFAIYSVVRLIALLVRIPVWIRALNSSIAIWAWNYIFLSFVVFDTTPIAPTEYLLLMPTLTEFWSMLCLPNINNLTSSNDE